MMRIRFTYPMASYIPYTEMKEFHPYPPVRMPNGKYVNVYYQDSVARHIAHQLKCGDEDALDTAAEFLACQIDCDCNVVPAPNSCGHAVYTLELCKLIQQKAKYNVNILDVLSSISRQSLYDMKAPIYKHAMETNTTPDFSNISLEFSVSDYEKSEMPTYFIDNIFSEGITFNAAKRCIPDIIPLCFAVTQQGLDKYTKLSENMAMPQMESMYDISDLDYVSEIVDVVYSSKTYDELMSILLTTTNPLMNIYDNERQCEMNHSLYGLPIHLIFYTDGRMDTQYNLSQSYAKSLVNNDGVERVINIFLSLTSLPHHISNGVTVYGEGRYASIFIDVLGSKARSKEWVDKLSNLPVDEQTEFLINCLNGTFNDRKSTLVHELTHNKTSMLVDGNKGMLGRFGGSKRKYLNDYPTRVKKYLHDTQGYTATYHDNFPGMEYDDDNKDRLASQLRFTSSDEINAMIKASLYMAVEHVYTDNSILQTDDISRIIYDFVMDREGYYILHPHYPKSLSNKLVRRIYFAANTIGSYIKHNFYDFKENRLSRSIKNMVANL